MQHAFDRWSPFWNKRYYHKHQTDDPIAGNSVKLPAFGNCSLKTIGPLNGLGY